MDTPGGPDVVGAPRSPAPVTLITVTFRSAAVLPGLLDSIRPALEGVDARVVVVDNASDDDSVAVARTSPVVDRVLALPHNGGYAAGINAGVAACPDSAAYLVLNPDIRLWPGSVAPLLRALADPRTAIAVPRLVDEHGVLLRSLRREPSVLRCAGEALIGGRRAGRWPPLGEVIMRPSAYEDPSTAAVWATGGAMLLSAAALRAIGPWDESFFLYEEEVEFALRARDRGYRLAYVPAAVATRVVGVEPPAPSIWALMRSNKVRLYARRHGRWHAHAFWAVLVAGEGVRALIGRPGSAAAVRALVGVRPR